jgi:Leucine-rich repeat (LRR) protein
MPAPVPATPVREPTTQKIITTWANEAPQGERRQEAANRITAFLNTPTATALDLSNLGLSSLPPVLTYQDFLANGPFYTRLRTLYLNKNKLMALPGLNFLCKLQYLYLNENSALQTIPNEVLTLPSSCTVDLTGIGMPQANLENLRTQSTEWNYRGPAITFCDFPPAAPTGQQPASIGGPFISLPKEPQPAPIGGPSMLSSTRAAHDSVRVREQDIPQILKTWVSESSPGEQRQEAANRITSFLTTPQATHLLLSNLGLRSLPPVFHLNREFSTRLKRLELGKNKLTALPAEIGAFRNLQILLVSRNRLTTLPTTIGQLQSLVNLDLDYNRLEALPAEIGRLRELRKLYVNKNQLTALPTTIGELQELRSLYVTSNQLTALPTTIGELQKLTILFVNMNQLGALPEAIAELRNLEVLSASDNQLRVLPTRIGQLRGLKQLTFSHNLLDVLPIGVCQLLRLENLALNSNRLAGLPSAIGQLQELTFLGLWDNQLRVLPNAIGQLQKLQTLLLYGNRDLQGLENDSLLLPPSCNNVELDGTGLSLDASHCLRRATRSSPGHTGPSRAAHAGSGH